MHTFGSCISWQRAQATQNDVTCKRTNDAHSTFHLSPYASLHPFHSRTRSRSRSHTTRLPIHLNQLKIIPDLTRKIDFGQSDSPPSLSILRMWVFVYVNNG